MFKKLNFSGKSSLLMLLALAAALLSENCVSIIGAKKQSVAFTSHPYGAKVYIDGKFAGEAPVRVKLHKRSPHVVRIEKEGYRPVEIMIRSRVSWGSVFISNAIWSIPFIFSWIGYGFDAQSESQQSISSMYGILALAVPIAAMVIDANSSDSRRFKSHIYVFLEKIEENEKSALLEMDAQEFQKVVWISVIGRDDGIKK